MRKCAIFFLIFVVVLAIAATIENSNKNLQEIELPKGQELSLYE